MYILGVDPTFIQAAGAVSAFALNTIGTSEPAGKIYQWVQADEALTVGNAVIIHEDGGAEQADTTSTAPATGQGLPAGLCVATIALNGFGWIQRNGVGDTTLNVATGCAAHTVINSTGTAGRLDDDASSGAEVIEGITTTGAEGSNVATCILSWPYVGRTL
jgi:hypothetical protein